MGIISTAIRRGALVGASALLATGLVACNEHPVSLTQATGDVESVVSQNLGGDKLDILWMIDNSGSMCRSQSIIREGIDDFIDIFEDGDLDFHIAVTTSHILDCDTVDPDDGLLVNQACSYERVARGGYLQATPQPLPGPDERCYHPVDNQAEPILEELDPLKESIEIAVSCTEDPSAYEHLINFNDPEWERTLRCALPTNPNVEPDDCDNDDPELEEFFPDPADYRDIDLVLRSEEYIVTDADVAERPDLSDADVGTLDTQRFRDDFACMSLVGTRGFGYEAGLAAAAMALSPEMTGGADTTVDQRDEYPNAGFLRSDADTSVIFVSDENDCSVDIEEMDFRTACGEGNCTIEENRLRQGLDSAMYSVEELYSDFVLNVLSNKRPELADEFFEVAQGDDAISIIDDLDEDDPLRLEIEGYTTSIYPASIHGAFQDLDELPPLIEEDEVPLECPDQQDGASGRAWEPPTSCLSPIGRAWSGHRYAFFLEKFANHFPTDEDGRIGGEICSDFSPVMVELGAFLESLAGGCIDEIYPCQGLDDMGCPDQAHTGEPGRCVPYRSNALVLPVLDDLSAADIEGVDGTQLDAFIDLVQQPEISVERAAQSTSLSLDDQARQNLLDALDQQIAQNDEASFYCDSGLEARLSAVHNDELTLDDVEATGYCFDGDTTDPSMPQSCVVNPDRYIWASCEGGGLRLDWDDAEAEQILDDFELLLRYARTSTTGQAPTADANNQEEPTNQQDATNQQDDDEG